jgi:hypothetical protein
MRPPKRSSLDWAVLGLLAALVATNAAFLIVQRTGGPAIGTAFYLVLLILTWGQRKRDHRKVVLGGLVGLAVHAIEVIALDWPAQPLLLVLNLTLPVPLVAAAWVADRRPERAGDSA